MASRISSSEGDRVWAKSARAAISMPGVQKPHCSAWVSQKASCRMLKVSGSGAKPSTVSTEVPSAWTAKIKQERTGRPSSSTEQAPHTPCSQPVCVPVRRSTSRRKSTKVIRAGASALSLRPLTVSETRCRDMGSGSSRHRLALRLGNGARGQRAGDAAAVIGRDVEIGLRLDRSLEGCHGFLDVVRFEFCPDQPLRRVIGGKRRRSDTPEGKAQAAADAILVEHKLA